MATEKQNDPVPHSSKRLGKLQRLTRREVEMKSSREKGKRDLFVTHANETLIPAYESQISQSQFRNPDIWWTTTTTGPREERRVVRGAGQGWNRRKMRGKIAISNRGKLVPVPVLLTAL